MNMLASQSNSTYDIPYLIKEFPEQIKSAQRHLSSRFTHTSYTKHNLPHWGQSNVIVFVTFRLADSLPAELVEKWRIERTRWTEEHPQPWNASDIQEYSQLFSRRREESLDAGHGECFLAESQCREIVGLALEYFNGERYSLHSYVIMPNHVHVLMELHESGGLQKIIKNWKSYTAREINRARGRSGAVWQRDYYDRLVRNEDHYKRCILYIRKNAYIAKCILGHCR